MIFERKIDEIQKVCPRIEDFLTQNISAILIKGLLGTGKTTLAIELLMAHGGGIYFSTRTSEEKMLKHMPSIQLLGKNPFKKFIDMRFGSAEILLKKMMESMMEDKRTLIVLDSWDSMAKEMDVVERLKVERSIVAMVEANESTVVFVSEEPDLTTTDHLVDAIVTLKDETYEGKRLRILEWDKLKGRSISKKKFVFTLDGGRFNILFGFRRLEEKAFVKIDLPKVTNGLDILLFEIGRNVHSKGIEPLVSALVSEFLLRGYSVITIPIGTETLKKMRGRAKELDVRGRFYIGSFQHYDKEDIFYLDPTSPKRVVDALIKKAKGLNPPSVYIIGCDILEHFFGRNGLTKIIFKLSRWVRENESLLMLLIGQGSRSLREIANISDVHVRFQVIEQTLIAYEVKPQGDSLYHIGYIFEGKAPKIGIIPIR